MPTYNQPSFQDFRNQISIIELAIHAGYEWQPKKGKTLPVLYHAGLNDHIVIKNPKDPGAQVYFQTGSYTDRGTLINFVSNRLTSCFSQFNNPSRSQAQNVNDVLKDYLNLVPERKQPVKLLEEFIYKGLTDHVNEHEFLIEYHKLCVLPAQNYLTESRFIHPDLLASPQFKDIIAVQRVYFEDGKPIILGGEELPPAGKKLVENIAFPYIPKDGEPIVGLELRNATFKSHAPGSDRSHGMWISNKPTGQTERIILGETGIDMLSYRQMEISTGLHTQEDSRYCSIGGSLSPSHLTTLQNFIVPDTKIILGFDNDVAGARYSLNALAYLNQNGIALTQASRQGFIALTIPPSAVREQISQLISDHNRVMSDYMGNAPAEVQVDIQTNMFLWNERPNTLEVPLKTVMLNAINSVLVEHGTFTHSVGIARARTKDFNEDLKQEMVRQAGRPYLLVNPDQNRIMYRGANAGQIKGYIDNEVKPGGRLSSMPNGTRLKLVKASPNKLYPTIQGELQVKDHVVSPTFTESFKAALHPERNRTNEQSY